MYVNNEIMKSAYVVKSEGHQAHGRSYRKISFPPLPRDWGKYRQRSSGGGGGDKRTKNLAEKGVILK
jgi:hypothetical protein